MGIGGSRDRSLRSATWIILWAGLICALYLPTLGTRFDFNDDGNLVYRSAPMAARARIDLYWRRVMANYRDLGPFRPVLWAHWTLQAEILGADAPRWRAARLLFGWLGATLLLALMLELGLRPGAAVGAVAIAMWSPARDEIWTSLTLSEGVAMPYAIAALLFALRAARSTRPLGWDMAGALSMLAAVCCKNTFAAIVPAQLLLRTWPEDGEWRNGWHARVWRASPLALTLALPAAHFAIFAIDWHPGQYTFGAPSGSQLARMLGVITKAASAPFVGPAVILAVLAIVMDSVRKVEASRPVVAGMVEAARVVWYEYRVALITGILLLVCGLAIYLPIKGASGRYSIPAVWGIDLFLGVLISALCGLAASARKRIAIVGLAVGMGGVAIANLAHQQRFAARAQCLWEALELVERRAPQVACVGWNYGPRLDIEEGIHFEWHLQGRGLNLPIALIDESGQVHERPEITNRCALPDVMLSGTDAPASDARFALVHRIDVPYLFGRRHFECYLWARSSA